MGSSERIISQDGTGLAILGTSALDPDEERRTGALTHGTRYRVGRGDTTEAIVDVHTDEEGSTHLLATSCTVPPFSTSMMLRREAPIGTKTFEGLVRLMADGAIDLAGRVPALYPAILAMRLGK